MLIKFLTFFSMLLSTIIVKIPIDDNISLSGNLTLADINEPLPLYLSIDEPYLNYNVDLKVYVDDEIIIDNKSTSNSYPKTFLIPGFKSTKETKQIKIISNYSLSNKENTEIEFNFSCDTYNNMVVQDLKNGKSISYSPIQTSFSAHGKSYSINPHYETFYSFGVSGYKCNLTRFVDFSLFKIKIDSIEEIPLDNCEVRLYTKIENSDLEYENHYTKLKVSLKKIDYNYYQLCNDYNYYIDKKNGGIYQNKTEYCDEELLPFFFPLSHGFLRTIPFEIIFNDIGLTHANLTFKNAFETGKEAYLNQQYFFKEIDENIKEVTYKYA